MEEEINNIEDEITCPYCNYEFGDSWEHGSDNGEYTEDCEECPECGKSFTWTRNITIDYRATGLCKENNVEHNWKEFDTGACKGRQCLTCDKYEFEKTGD